MQVYEPQKAPHTSLRVLSGIGVDIGLEERGVDNCVYSGVYEGVCERWQRPRRRARGVGEPRLSGGLSVSIRRYSG